MRRRIEQHEQHGQPCDVSREVQGLNQTGAGRAARSSWRAASAMGRGAHKPAAQVMTFGTSRRDQRHCAAGAAPQHTDPSTQPDQEDSPMKSLLILPELRRAEPDCRRHAGELTVTITDIREAQGSLMVSVVDSDAAWNNQAKPVAAKKIAAIKGEVKLNFPTCLPASTRCRSCTMRTATTSSTPTSSAFHPRVMASATTPT